MNSHNNRPDKGKGGRRVGGPKRLAVNVLGAVGGLRLIKWLTRFSPRILMYHRFGVDSEGRRMPATAFERQVRLLKEHFHVTTMSSLGEMLRTGQRVPANTAVITVDDGYEDFYSHAFPVLQRYALPATFYVTSRFVDREIWLWPDVVAYIIGNTKKRRWSIALDGKERYFEFSETTTDRRIWVDICQYALGLDETRKVGLLSDLALQLGVQVPSEPVDSCRAVSWDQLREMSQAGIEVAGHTATHPRLVKIEDSALAGEIAGSKQRIEEMMDRTVYSFAYPNGEKGDYDARTKKLVEQAGYTSATVAFPKAGIRDRFELGRYSIGNGMNEFRDVIWGARAVSGRMQELLEIA